MILIQSGEAKGKVSRWAKILGLNKRTLYHRLSKEKGIEYVLFKGKHRPEMNSKQMRLF